MLASHINHKSLSSQKISTNEWARNICQKELPRERLLANVKVDLACTICVNASAIGSNKSWAIVVLKITILQSPGPAGVTLTSAPVSIKKLCPDGMSDANSKVEPPATEITENLLTMA